MKNIAVEQENNLTKNLDKLTKGAGSEDISIDIFCESMVDYLEKLNAASAGRYELDDYDMQVISIAMDQYLCCLTSSHRK